MCIKQARKMDEVSLSDTVLMSAFSDDKDMEAETENLHLRLRL